MSAENTTGSSKPASLFRGSLRSLLPALVCAALCVAIMQSGFFTFFFVTLSLIGSVSILPVFIGFLCFFLIEFLSFKEIKRKGGRNQHFAPVLIMILPKKPHTFRFPLLSFAVTSLAALLVFLFFPGFSPELRGRPRMEFTNFPFQSEYDAHMAFQASFSMVSLNAYQDEPSHNEYLRYFLGEDGLIAGTENSFFVWEIPAFPLEKLTEFLLNYEDKIVETPQPILKDWIIVALILVCCIPGTQNAEKRRLSKNKAPLIRDRRVAA